MACASALLLLLSFLPVRRSEEKKQNKKEEEREEGVGLAGKRGIYKMTKAAAVVVYLTCWRVARPSKAFRLVCLECERPLLPFVKHSQHTHTQNPDKMGKIILKNKKETDQAPSSLSGGKGGLTDDAINLSIEVCFAKKKEKVLISYFGLFIVSFPPVCRKGKLQYHGTILFCFVGRVE